MELVVAVRIPLQLRQTFLPFGPVHKVQLHQSKTSPLPPKSWGKMQLSTMTDEFLAETNCDFLAKTNCVYKMASDAEQRSAAVGALNAVGTLFESNALP